MSNKVFPNMKTYIPVRFVIVCLSCLLLAEASSASQDGTQSGEALFEQNCVMCHGGSDVRAATRGALAAMTPDSIYAALTDGPMREMAKGLSDEQRRNLAEYLTRRKIGEVTVARPKVMCPVGDDWFDFGRHPSITGWGLTNTQNTRFIPGDVAKLSATDVKKLKLKWAFSFPDAVEAHSQPAVAAGAVFVGAQNGKLYALDAGSGCQHWAFQGSSGIRGAITIADWESNDGRPSDKGPTVYFGDNSGHAYAINAVTGTQLWKTNVGDPNAARSMVSGPVTLHGDRVYVPVTPRPVGDDMDPNTSCCTHRGAIWSLDAGTGSVIWNSFVIPTEPTEQYRNSHGVPQFGPSGAGVWSSPAIDEKRKRLYIGTGENSTIPAENGGAVVAINLLDGSIAWSHQLYPQETYNGDCINYIGPNCPPLFQGRIGLDTSSAMLLQNPDGSDIVVAANKPGDVFGLDPDTGKLLWRRVITRGDYNWGVLHGMASDGTTVFATVHDKHLMNFQKGPYWGEEELGIYAINAFTGEPLWRALVSDHCAVARCRGYSAAATAIPGVLFVGARDGYARAFDINTGKLLWETATAQDFTTLGGDVARGGGINPAAPVVADGMIYVNSGDLRGIPGNVLLAFSVDGK